jgi:hypothetical protein
MEGQEYSLRPQSARRSVARSTGPVAAVQESQGSARCGAGAAPEGFVRIADNGSSSQRGRPGSGTRIDMWGKQNGSPRYSPYAAYIAVGHSTVVSLVLAALTQADWQEETDCLNFRFSFATL